MKREPVIPCILAFLIMSSTLVLGGALNPDQAKLNIKARLLTEIADLQKAKNQPPPKFQSAIIPVDQWEKHQMTTLMWRNELDRQKRLLKTLFSQVDRTPSAHLAEMIAHIYWGDGENAHLYPPMYYYAVDLGELMIPYIERDFDKAAPDGQMDMLSLLIQMHSRDTLAVVRKALDSRDERVSALAQTALRSILGLDARPELVKMLVLSRSSWYIKHTLGEMALSGDPDWYRTFFDMVRRDAITLADIASISHLDNCPEEVIGENVDLLTRAIFSIPSPINQGSRFWAHQFILKLSQPGYIDKLTVLLPGLLSDRYRYGGVLKPFTSLSTARQKRIFDFFDTDADLLISRISGNLSADQVAGLLKPGVANTLVRLYLESLLSLRSGSSIVASEQRYNFRAEVFNEEGQVVAVRDFSLKLGEEQVVELKTSNGANVVRNLKTALRLDRSQWAFVMDCRIDLKPAGVGFDLTIPIGGGADMQLYDTIALKRELQVWRIRHLDLFL